MKKIYLVILLMAATIAAFGQSTYNKHQLTIAGGLFSDNEAVGLFSDVLSILLPLGYKKMNSEPQIAELSLGYKYNVAPRVDVGISLSYNSSKGDAYYFDTKVGDFHRQFYTIAAEGYYRYIDRDHLRLYGMVGLGVTYVTQDYDATSAMSLEDNQTSYFNFQVTPIGVAYGNKLGVLAEVGYGYKGILNVGVFYRFY